MLDLLAQGGTWAAGLPLLVVETVLLCAALAGWGALVERALVRGRQFDLFERGVLGMAALYAVAVLLSLVTAYTPAVSSAVILVGVGSCLYVTVRGRRWWQWAVLGVLAIYFVGGVALTSLHYDTGLYHLQVIRWFQAEPLPLGLANLHIRFGYNSAWFVLASLLGASPLAPDGTFLLNGVLSVFVCGALLARVWCGYRQRRVTFATLLAAVLVLTYLGTAFHSLFGWMGLAPATDIPAALLTIYAAVLAASLIEDDSAAPDARLILAGAAACLAVAVKLSQFPTALLVILVALRLGLHRKPVWRKTLVVTGSAMVAVSGAWLLHSMMLSGCLLFPYGVSCVGCIPWSADPAQADRLARMLKMWARVPKAGVAVPDGWAWIPLWLEYMWPDRTIIKWIAYWSAALAMLSLLFALFARRRAGQPVPAAGFAWCLGLGAAGIVLCAVTAPDPRYYLGYFFLLPGSLVARLYTGPWGRAGGGARRGLGVAAALLLVAGAVHSMKDRFTVSHLDEPCCEWRALPAVPYHVETMPGGYAVKVPDQGDQCWDLPLPCTPSDQLNPNLRRKRVLGRTAFSR